MTPEMVAMEAHKRRCAYCERWLLARIAELLAWAATDEAAPPPPPNSCAVGAALYDAAMRSVSARRRRPAERTGNC